jgi:hypothetical protein
MRHLALLFTLPLLTIALAATAKAATPVAVTPPLELLSAAAGEAEAGDGEEAEEGEFEEGEGCELEADCEEWEEGEEDEECVLEEASAVVSPNPSTGKVRVTVRYEAYQPATFALVYSLRGGKGSLHLGSARAQLRYAGAFHDTLTVGHRNLPRLAAARQFTVELQPLGSPGFCRERLTSAAPRRASQKHRAGGRGRSGGRARTRGS